jgi:hypothetical protein
MPMSDAKEIVSVCADTLKDARTNTSDWASKRSTDVLKSILALLRVHRQQCANDAKVGVLSSVSVSELGFFFPSVLCVVISGVLVLDLRPHVVVVLVAFLFFAFVFAFEFCSLLKMSVSLSLCLSLELSPRICALNCDVVSVFCLFACLYVCLFACVSVALVFQDLVKRFHRG